MKPISLQTLAGFVGVSLPSGQGERLVTRVDTDSRNFKSGDVFLAIVGERFDAHQFIPQVMAAGAAAVVVNHLDPAWPTDLCPVIQVEDTVAAFQAIARGYRSWHQPLIIGLTGSNGKTSTKDLTALIMGLKMQTYATFGNLNSQIGLPMSLLAMGEGDECGVIEMGMGEPGSLKKLVDTAMPDAAILTNVGLAHMEFFGSQDGIAWEKATLPAGVHGDGVVVLNANDPYTPRIARHCQATVYTAGAENGDVHAFDLRPGSDGTHFKLNFAGTVVETFLPVIGRHMVGNAAMAACMGWAHGISPEDIAGVLSSARLTGGRMETKTFQEILFIDDSYNANPDSMKAGLATLASLQRAGQKVAVLGRMGELGPLAREGHEGVGRYAASLGLDTICTVGDEAAFISDAARAEGQRETFNFPTHEACVAHLQKVLHPGDTVLLKGSRSAGMEKILPYFQTA